MTVSAKFERTLYFARCKDCGPTREAAKFDDDEARQNWVKAHWMVAHPLQSDVVTVQWEEKR